MVMLSQLLMNSLEIIETYWNVNSLTVDLEKGRWYEIIETYWNVNVCYWSIETKISLK